MNYLTNRVAIITGAGRGLGRSHALYMARQGAKVLVNDIDSLACAETVHLIEQIGGKAVANTNSVQDIEGTEEIAASALCVYGKIDILVNNAGNLHDGAFKNQDSDAWNDILTTHLTGTRNMTKSVWPVMCKNKYGRIVMTTSTSGLYGNFGQTNYAAAKLGILGLAQSLKEEGEKYNILVNSVAPLASTRMTQDLLPTDIQQLFRPDYVSAIVAYFASDVCTLSGECWITGAGHIARVAIAEGQGVYLQKDELCIEDIINELDRIRNLNMYSLPRNGQETAQKIISKLQEIATKEKL